MVYGLWFMVLSFFIISPEAQNICLNHQNYRTLYFLVQLRESRADD